ncbi:MAG: hypothetical protein M3389_16145, partial [Actinomycetota bacterium]|nr:hypothetical protein [Actinomycetota bacterium]
GPPAAPLAATAAPGFSGTGRTVAEDGQTVLELPGIGTIYVAGCRRFSEGGDVALFGALALRNTSAATFFVGTDVVPPGGKGVVTQSSQWDSHEAPHYHPRSPEPVRIVAASGAKQALVHVTTRLGPNGCRWWVMASVS